MRESESFLDLNVDLNINFDYLTLKDIQQLL